MLKKSYIHIYKGEGKGKTSILNGMVARALGNNLKVCYLRFLKNRPSGEIVFFQKQSNIIIKNYYQFSQKFFWEMNDNEKQKLHDETNQGLKDLAICSSNGEFDLIVVDEILGCIQNNLINEPELIKILKQKHVKTEIALSGRYCSYAIEQVADLVSEVKEIKHYFQNGQVAREGIDF